MIYKRNGKMQITVKVEGKPKPKQRFSPDENFRKMRRRVEDIEEDRRRKEEEFDW